MSVPATSTVIKPPAVLAAKPAVAEGGGVGAAAPVGPVIPAAPSSPAEPVGPVGPIIYAQTVRLKYREFLFG